MDINKVVFGDFSIGAKNAQNKKSEGKEENTSNVNVGSETKSVDAEAVLNALDIAAMQNKVQISKPEKKEINPSDYLTEDRIADIEAMMGTFENGVDVVANVIDEELPGFFAEDAKLALAAKIFAQE